MWLVDMAGNKMDFDAATVVVLQAWLATTAMSGHFLMSVVTTFV